VTINIGAIVVTTALRNPILSVKTSHSSDLVGVSGVERKGG
jgi:hypothetical protein